MPKECFIPKDFQASTLEVIVQANRIIQEYQADGYSLTLRQLYYQFVARDLIPNRQREYKRLGSILNDARLAGLVDWHAIEDRTRNLERQPTWDDPADIVGVVSRQFRVDRWENQPVRVEVWIEKDALAGVFERVCNRFGVPYFSCRGYTSQSEMYGAHERFMDYLEAGQDVVILHFGDHDPSGVDMTRDISERLAMFLTGDPDARRVRGFDVRRLALNMDQVDAWNPPPNPAKVTDSRAGGYIARFGRSSWELDALDPRTLSRLVETAITELLDDDAWEETGERIREGRELLSLVSDHWDDVAAHVRTLGA